MKPLPSDFAWKVEILAMEAEGSLVNAQPLPSIDWIRSLLSLPGFEPAGEGAA